MIDANIRRLIDSPLAHAGQLLAAAGIGADAVTIGGCLIGLAAALAVSAGQFYIALALLIANRIADRLDGAIARATRLLIAALSLISRSTFCLCGCAVGSPGRRDVLVF